MVCTTDLWTVNDRGQTPCLVAAVLEAPCQGGDIVYIGPLANNSTLCQCNTVTYSLVSACAACQGQRFISWSQWIANCTTSNVSIATYPLRLPTSVQVPSWAYLNVTIDDFWNATASLNNHNADSLQNLTSTSTSTNPGPSRSTVTPSITSLIPTLAGPTGFKSVRPGVIAAGAVGGFLFVACLAIAALVLKGKARKDAQSKPGGLEQTEANPYSLSMPGGGLARLYDPADPSTFPPTPPFEYRAPGFLGSPRYPTEGGLSSISEHYPEALARYSQLQQSVAGPSMQGKQVMPVVYV